jgi:hypothetical protein
MALKKTSFNLPERVYRATKVWAAHTDRTIGQVVSDALKFYLDKDTRSRPNSPEPGDGPTPDGGVAAEVPAEGKT